MFSLKKLILLFIDEGIMRALVLAFCVGICLIFSAVAEEEDTIYSVVNKEDTKTFSELLSIGYEVDDADGDGNTPLMIAAALGKSNFLLYLIDLGAEVNRRNYDGVSALHFAASAGHNNIIDILFANDAVINMPDYEGNTPLHYAVKANHRFIVERLVKEGADIKFVNANGETALDIAEKSRFNDIAVYLKSKLEQ